MHAPVDGLTGDDVALRLGDLVVHRDLEHEEQARGHVHQQADQERLPEAEEEERQGQGEDEVHPDDQDVLQPLHHGEARRGVETGEEALHAAKEVLKGPEREPEHVDEPGIDVLPPVPGAVWQAGLHALEGVVVLEILLGQGEDVVALDV